MLDTVPLLMVSPPLAKDVTTASEKVTLNVAVAATSVPTEMDLMIGGTGS